MNKLGLIGGTGPESTIITKMKEEENIEALILGCTELPLLLNDDISPVPCLDTTKLHTDALVKRIMEPNEI